jgi:hypothetical protein
METSPHIAFSFASPVNAGVTSANLNASVDEWNEDAIVVIINSPASADIPCEGLGIVHLSSGGADRYMAMTSYSIVVGH